MVFRRTDGKAAILDPHLASTALVTNEWNRQRHEMFKRNILKVVKDSACFWLYVSSGCLSPEVPECMSYWAVGCWSPGDKQRARCLIDTAFSTMQGIAKRIGDKEWTRISYLLQ